MYASVETRRDFLKSVGLGTASLLLPGYVGITSVSAEKSGAKRPNVVLVMTEDRGQRTEDRKIRLLISDFRLLMYDHQHRRQHSTIDALPKGQSP